MQQLHFRLLTTDGAPIRALPDHVNQAKSQAQSSIGQSVPSDQCDICKRSGLPLGRYRGSFDTAWARRSAWILQYFDPSGHRAYLKSVRGEIGQEWIRDVAAYKTWIEQENCDSTQKTPDQLRLWISGEHATGKTSLTLFILKEVERLRTRSSARIQLLYFFCHRPYARRNNASAILKGWLQQLMQQRPDLMADFYEWVSERDNRFLYLNNPAALWEIFRRLLKVDGAGTTYCIVDGLHECDMESVKVMGELLMRPFPAEGCLENAARLKVMVTSRFTMPSNKFAKIDLDEQDIEESGIPMARHLTLLDKHLCDLGDDKKRVCLQMLETIATYRDPPTNDQLQKYFNEPNDEVQKGIDLCESFIMRDAAQGLQFRFPDLWHIFSHSNNAPAIHAKLARDCLTVIDQKLPQIDMEYLEQEPSVWLLGMAPDVQYAVLHWAEHIKSAQDTSIDILERILDTFSRKSMTVEKYLIIYLQMRYAVSQEDTTRQHHTTVLHLIAFFGLHDLLQTAYKSGHWLRLKNYLITKDCLNMDPLSIAISQGHTKTAVFLKIYCKITLVHCHYAAGSNKLLANIIFPNYSGGRIDRVAMVRLLERAVTTGDEELVSRTIGFLIMAVPRNTFPWKEVGSLSHAIETGQRHLLRSLLTITNLEAAADELVEHAARQHEEIILADLMSLPEIRNIIKAQKITLVDALNCALVHKCPLMVDRLMSDKNVIEEDDEYRSPLHVAALYANDQTLCRFLQHPKFLFNRGSMEEGVALNLLLHKDQTEALINLKQILERGARMRYEHFGITTLHVVAELGRIFVMRMLLEMMSIKEIEEDIDRQPSSIHGLERADKTALMIAAMKGHVDIVRLLLHAGADVEMRDRRGKTALVLAQEGGHAEVVQLLGEGKEGGMQTAKEELGRKEEDAGEAWCGNEPQKQDDTGKTKVKGKGRSTRRK
ncbi:Nn.00g108340.m01.CDS01 [Neocucurbitaria sp. VM-36]